MSNKPNKWIAAVLGLVLMPTGMMYVARAKLALAYFSVAMTVAVLGFVSPVWPAASGAALAVLVIACAVHAFRLAKRYPDGMPRPGYSRWYGVTATVVGWVVFVVVVRSFLYEPYRAPSGSMLPTIPERAHLIAQKWGYGNYGTFGVNLRRAPIAAPLARGDLIVFEFPQDRSVSFVKRLVGLPGDKIAYREKRLFINGEAVPLRPAGDFVGAGPFVGRKLQFIESLAGREHGVLLGEAPSRLDGRTADFPFSERCTYEQGAMACEVPPGHFFVLGDNRDNSNDSRMWGFLPANHVIGKVVFIAG